MRINSNTGISPGLDASQGARNSPAERAEGASGQLAPDTAQVSGRVNPQTLTAALNQVRDTRQERVAALAEKVRNGSYVLDSGQTAEAVMSHMTAPAA